MKTFAFHTTPAIRFGFGIRSELPSAFRLTAKTNVLLVTDQGIVRAKLLDKILAVLEAANVPVVVFDKVLADPPAAIVEEAAALARSSGAQAVIGLGGGSSLDVAKLAALLARSDETLDDIYGVNKAVGPRLPLALIPTTSGTGSEVTPIAIVTTAASEKKGVSSPVLLPDLALLDPELTLDLPAHVTAATGIDAMVHAIEAYTSASPNNNPVSRMLAAQALEMLAGALITAVRDGSDASARSRMLLGSMLAGQAFANSPVAAVHALAYPLGGHYHLAHGLTNALVLPHVLRFNLPACEAAYRELAVIAFPGLRSTAEDERAQAFIAEMCALSQACGLPQRLRDAGVERTALPALAADAMLQTRLLVNNPRPIQLDDALAIYEAAW